MRDTNAPITRTRKPRGQGASRRGEILAAATRIFVDEGVANATMRRIAAQVGVSTTALYVYFPDKNAILDAIAEASFSKLLESLEASQGKGSVPERFGAGLRSYVAFGLAHPDEYRLIFLSAPAASKAEGCRTLPAADRSFAILQRGVEEMIAAGLFRPAPSMPVAEAIWACLHGVTSVLLNQTEHLLTPGDILLDTVINMTIAGFR